MAMRGWMAHAMTWAAVVCITVSAAGAEEPRWANGVLSLTFENDTFSSEDRYYTNGLRLAWQTPATESALLQRVGRTLAPWLLPAEAEIGWGVSISQSIFTSRKRLTPNPPRDDHPYAGHLAGAFTLSAASANSLGILELSLGVIGPSSGAEETQELAHRVLDRRRVRGWDRQLDDRPAGLLALERRWHRALATGPLGLELGVVPAVGVHLGNVQTSAAGGALLRIGHGLEMDFGPPRVRPALSGLGIFRPPEGFAWYLFAGVEGRAIAYQETLDGNRNGFWQIDREPLVADVPIGLVLAYGRTRLAFTFVSQTRTFDEQPDPWHRFGSLTLSLAL